MKPTHRSSGAAATAAVGATTTDACYATNVKLKEVDFDVKINSMKLVRLVRSQEVLYNSDVVGYTDKAFKETIWERIHKSLFPKYDTFEPKLQDCVRTSVRRRWKTLRDAIAREVKKNATVENYCRKKESPIISELEFLIPHIKSQYCVRLSDELGLREQFSYINEPEENVDDLIDLTEDCDIKSIIKPEYDLDLSPDIFHLTTQLTVDDEHSFNDMPNEANNWNREYCTVAEFKGGEFINPTLCTDQENVESLSEEDKPNTNSGGNERKRARLDTTEDVTEMQAKILQLLTNLERRERAEARLEQEAQDEDRMFLLSLVSDLRRVPAAKKVQVKAEIANAIARANQT